MYRRRPAAIAGNADLWHEVLAARHDPQTDQTAGDGEAKIAAAAAKKVAKAARGGAMFSGTAPVVDQTSMNAMAMAMQDEPLLSPIDKSFLTDARSPSSSPKSQ
jgi:hypothetical protein